MIDRRTFLKLSAGALVLTAAGALTGCGGMNDRPKVTIDGVVFMCEAPVITGGSGYAVRYCPLFAIQNDTGERVILEPKDITGTFTDMENNMYPLEFIRNELTVEPHSYQEYGSSAKFCLESENRVPAEYSNGTFIMRVAYHNQTAVFRYDGKTITPQQRIRFGQHFAAGHSWKQECPVAFLFCAALPVLYIGAGSVHKVLRTFCTSMVAARAAKR